MTPTVTNDRFRPGIIELNQIVQPLQTIPWNTDILPRIRRSHADAQTSPPGHLECSRKSSDVPAIPRTLDFEFSLADSGRLLPVNLPDNFAAPESSLGVTPYAFGGDPFRAVASVRSRAADMVLVGMGGQRQQQGYQ
jgi:hypothetical protein